jgi:hypothetical protein
MSDSSGFSSKSVTGSTSTMVALVGSLIALIGSFLTWATISGGGVSVNVGGTTEGGDGVITLIVAIATAAAAIFLKNKARMITVVIGGAILAIVGVVNVLDINSTATDYGDIGVSVSVGIGLWMVLAGGVVAVVGAFLKK